MKSQSVLCNQNVRRILGTEPDLHTKIICTQRRVQRCELLYYLDVCDTLHPWYKNSAIYYT